MTALHAPELSAEQIADIEAAIAAASSAVDWRPTGAATGITYTDIFCGYGGSSIGLENAGLHLQLAANHWDKAIETHAANFPHADHVIADVSNYDMRRLPDSDVLWASPICTELSPAGGRRRRYTNQLSLLEPLGHIPNAALDRTRATFWDVIRATEVHRYKVVITENVVEAASWELFDIWLSAMDTLGYRHQFVSVSSAHIGDQSNPHAPQWRDRLYIVYLDCSNRADLRRWQDERQEGELDVSIRIVGRADDEVAPVSACADPDGPLVVLMAADCCQRFVDNFCGVASADEQDQGGLGVAPDQVAKKLIECVAESLRSAPDLAFSDEYIAVFVAYQDVGLSFTVEHFTGRFALELRVEIDQQCVAKHHLAEFLHRRWGPFESVAARCEDVERCFVGVIRQHGLRRERRRGVWPPCRDDRFAPDRHGKAVGVAAAMDWEADLRLQIALTEDVGLSGGDRGGHAAKVARVGVDIDFGPAEVLVDLVEGGVQGMTNLLGVAELAVRSHQRNLQLPAPVGPSGHLCLGRRGCAELACLQVEDFGVACERDDIAAHLDGLPERVAETVRDWVVSSLAGQSVNSCPIEHWAFDGEMFRDLLRQVVLGRLQQAVRVHGLDRLLGILQSAAQIDVQAGAAEQRRMHRDGCHRSVRLSLAMEKSPVVARFRSPVLAR